MKKKTVLFLMLAPYLLFASSTAARAYTMADYWSFDAGNVWIYDRDLFVVGAEEHAFASYTGIQFMQARGICDGYFYVYTGPEGILGIGIYSLDSNSWIDFSSTPVKFANAQMDLGDVVSTTIPAGVIDEDAISFEITLQAEETVTVPAGTFNNALRMQIVVDDGLGIYTERVWLARGVGPVKMYRVSETNSTPGCFMTCGSLDCEENEVEERNILLKQFIEGRQGVVVIPLE
ncbi:MAG: hypothetical protein JW793_12230 [Acidobacteria bacterium]|nr:hypothetical protein [Acidobacteriota bacterium]